MISDSLKKAAPHASLKKLQEKCLKVLLPTSKEGCWVFCLIRSLFARSQSTRAPGDDDKLDCAPAPQPVRANCLCSRDSCAQSLCSLTNPQETVQLQDFTGISILRQDSSSIQLGTTLVKSILSYPFPFVSVCVELELSCRAVFSFFISLSFLLLCLLSKELTHFLLSFVFLLLA